MPPVEPPPTPWAFPPAARADEHGFLGVGADLEPGTVLAAYRRGLFPMPLHPRRRRERMAWWSPDPRGVLPLDSLRVSRSLRQSARRFDVRVDTAFDAVVAACAGVRRSGGWISTDVRHAYGRLHAAGWTHSVEAWTDDGRLAGGLYGVAIGGLFAGESMFHVPEPWGRDASKVALVRLVELLVAAGTPGQRVLDVQWPTPHLESLGVVAVPRSAYLHRLETALTLPLPPAFAG